LLDAVSWDSLAASLVARRPLLRVHSVFQRSLNLVSGDGELLGLVSSQAGNGPSTIVLQSIPPSGLDQFGLAPGDAAEAREDYVWIAETVAVRLADARRWQAAATGRCVGAALAVARVAHAELIAREAGPAGGLAPLLPHLSTLCEAAGSEPPGGLDLVSRAAWRGAGRLAAAWRRRDQSAVQRAAKHLAGLGPGLTPSGDDLLAGFLIGSARADFERPELAHACVHAAIGRTTDIAVARVRHAAKGSIEEVQEDVVTSLLGHDGSRLVTATARAARWGHTSGVDTLVGVFLGVRVGLMGDSG
jgi:hypothetical protein